MKNQIHKQTPLRETKRAKAFKLLNGKQVKNQAFV
jgi:hypothetical protein